MPTKGWILRRLKVAVEVSNVIVAAAAVIALALTCEQTRQLAAQNDEMASTLAEAGKAFRAESAPLVKAVGGFWVPKVERISCDEPPLGIRILFRNVSRVAVFISSTSIAVNVGERQVFASLKHKVTAGGEFLLPPNGENGTSLLDSAEVASFFSTLMGIDSPQVRIYWTATFRSVTDDQSFETKGTILALTDCRSPQQLPWGEGDNSIARVTESR